MSQISTVQVPCLVIQLNNTVIINNYGVIGTVLQVPCRNDFQDDPNYWMVPVKDAGIFTGFTPVPAYGATAPRPTFDSIPVFRVRDKLSGYTWWIYGTNQNFTDACSTCCGSGAIPMPGTNPAAPLVIMIAPCQILCIQNASSQFYEITALPKLNGAGAFFPIGSYNNLPFPAASANGYATVALLLAYLNSTWTNIGNPNATFVYTVSPDNITLTITGGFLNDSLCIVITTVNQSM